MTSTQSQIDWSSATRWYDENSDTYEMTTLEMPISQDLVDFAEELPEGARVLDLGCGAGRDARWLCDAGFQVTAMDLSQAMLDATLANTRGRAVLRCQDIRDFADAEGTWDGIWAMASLHHLPREEMQECLRRLVSSLTETGHLYLCVKEGTGAETDGSGRPFTYYQFDEIVRMAFAAFPGQGDVCCYKLETADFSGTPVSWICLDLRRDRPS